MYNESTIAVVVLLIFTLAFVVRKIHLQSKRDVIDILKRKESRQLIFGALVIFLVITSLIVHYGLMQIQQQLKQQSMTTLSATLDNTNASLMNWFDKQQNVINSLAKDADIQALSQQLLRINPNAIVDSPELLELRKRVQELTKDYTQVGFFVIGQDHRNYASMRDVNIGALSPIHQQRPDVLEQAFTGKTVLVPPMRSDVPLHKLQKGLGAYNTTMFSIAPLKNPQGEVFAVFAIRIDPFIDFYPIINNAQVGTSGETILIDNMGLLISPSRFEKQLANVDLIRPGQSSILAIEARDPGRLLSPENKGSVYRQKLPLMESAASVITKKEGLNEAGYRDYLGGEVIGVWQWNESLNLGLICQIRLSEVQQGYVDLRNTVSAVLLSILALCLILANIGMNILRRMNKRLVRANSNLENRVAERTKTISDREHKLWDLYENAPIAYASVHCNGEISQHNRKFAELFGYERDHISQLRWRQMMPSQNDDEPGIELFDKACVGESISDKNIAITTHLGQQRTLSANAFLSEDKSEVKISLVDVSERENALAQLASNEYQLRSVVESLPGVVFRIQYHKDSLTPIPLDYISNQIFTLSGYRADDFVGPKAKRKFIDLFSPDNHQILYQAVHLSVSDKQSFIINAQVITRKGDSKPVQVAANSWFDSAQGLHLIDGVVIDCSKVQSHPTNLTQSEQKYYSVINAVADALIVVDIDGQVLEINNSVIKMFGYQSEEIIGQHISLLQDSEISAEQDKILAFEHQNGTTSLLTSGREIIAKHKNGELFPIDVCTRELPLEGESCFVVVLRDISERHQKMVQLKANETRLDASTNAARIGLWEYLPNTQEVRINTILATMLGYEPNELMQDNSPWSALKDGLKIWRELIHPDDKISAEHQMQCYLAGQTDEFRQQLRLLCKDGSYKWVLDIGRITKVNEQGNPTRVSGVHIDINDIKQQEQHHLEALTIAEKANQAKADFLANISDEIRSPMNTIIEMTQFASERSEDSQQKSYISKAQRSANSLLGVLNDIVDFSKIEMGELNIEKAPFNLHDVLNDLATAMSVKAEQNQLELIFDIEANTPMMLHGDRLRLTQVLTNLCNNAIKHSDQGDLILTIEKPFFNADYVDLKFTLTDTGMKISEQLQRTIFDPLVPNEQPEHSSSEPHVGSLGEGIGLVIASQLVSLMGGKINVGNSADQGSTFYFNLTFDRQSQVQEKLEEKSKLDNIDNILIVDDNDHAADILKKILATQGYNVLLVKSASQAFELLQQHDAKAPIDLVFMDWLMPVMDGVKASREIQYNLSLEQIPEIIMLSAFDTDELNALTKDLDICAILTKPVMPSTVLSALTTLELRD
ncbi:PAS domain S-box protein [Thalassotalea aquiviva]|uniref:PAS domain S-box protein n=1 Tax=Thalassotalea aquiviva TaxID=3242415 RepID=UPI00352B568C